MDADTGEKRYSHNVKNTSPKTRKQEIQSVSFFILNMLAMTAYSLKISIFVGVLISVFIVAMECDRNKFIISTLNIVFLLEIFFYCRLYSFTRWKRILAEMRNVRKFIIIVI